MADLWSVVVGGAIAAASGVATQVCVHIFRTREERRTRTIAKFEELIAAIYEHERWMHVRRNYYVFKEGDIPSADPMAKIEALCSIYFPDLMGAGSTMNYHATAYTVWMTKAGSKQLSGDANAIDGYDKALQPYLSANHDLLNAARKYGKEKFAMTVKTTTAKPGQQ